MVERANWGNKPFFKLSKVEAADLNKILKDNENDKEIPLSTEQAFLQPFDMFFSCNICLAVVSP